MKNKRLLTLFSSISLILVLGLSLVLGCTPKPTSTLTPTASAPTPTSSKTSAEKWPENVMILVTGGLTGGMYTHLSAWTTIMEQDTGMALRIIPEDNLNKRVETVIKEPNAMAIEGQQASAVVIESVGACATRFSPPYQVRLACSIGSGWAGAIVRENSPYYTLKDLKPGVRWPALRKEPPYMKTLEAMFAWAGIDPYEEAVPVEFADWGQAVKALGDGGVDVCYQISNAAGVYELAAMPNGIRFLEMDPQKDPEAAKRFLKLKPTVGFGICRAGEPHSIGVPMIAYLTALWTNETTDTEFIYQLTKWRADNFDRYKDKFEGLELGHPDLLIDWLPYLYLPLHDGIIKYFKEKGSWTEANEARQQENIALVTKYVDAYQAAIAEADKKGIKIDPLEQEWQDLWSSYKKDIPIFKTPID